jgi:hypothetical protein
MRRLATRHLPAFPDVIAPDGSAVRLLAQLGGGSLAHFELAPGQTSRAVAHRTVEGSGISFTVAERCGANSTATSR